MSTDQASVDDMTADNSTAAPEAASANNNNRKGSRMTLWIMVVLFALPNIAAIYFYLNRDSIDLSRFSTNYGTIVSPVRQPGDMPLKTLDGSDFLLSSMQGKWIMVSIGSSRCEQDCRDNIYKMRQIRKATGEFYKRIERLFFLTDTVALDDFKTLMQDYRGMEVVLPGEPAEAYRDYLSVFSLNGEDVVDGIYFIDPLGNYMMAYPKQAEAKKILKDLMRLLKVSQIG